jgi:hypothetical protein
MCRGLPALSPGARPTPEEFPDARRFPLLAWATLLIPLAAVILCLWLIPFARFSPVTGTAQLLGGETGFTVSAYVLCFFIAGVLITAICWLGPKTFYAFMLDLALDEETWFRYGSEGWRWTMRIRSCLAFGFAHLLNLIVAAVTLGALVLVGAVYMAVYLHEHRRTGDPRRALLTTAYFHCDYNMAALTLPLLGTVILLSELALRLF